MRVYFVYASGVSRSAKKLHMVESSKMLLYFSPFEGRLFMRFHPRMGSTHIRHIAALLVLTGRRHSEYAVPAAVRGTCTGYLYLFSIYLDFILSIYLSISSLSRRKEIERDRESLLQLFVRLTYVLYVHVPPRGL